MAQSKTLLRDRVGLCHAVPHRHGTKSHSRAPGTPDWSCNTQKEGTVPHGMCAGVGMCCTRCCQSGQGRGPTANRGMSHSGQGRNPTVDRGMSHSEQGRVPQWTGEGPTGAPRRGRVVLGGKAPRISTVPSPHHPPHLELPSGIELFQALHCLLPVHHGGHGRTLLQGRVGSAPGASGHWAGVTHAGGHVALTQTHGCLRASWAVMRLAGLMVSI